MGNGTGFVCSDCHVKTLASFDVATCADCHTTINPGFMSQHEKDFGNQCLQCHIGNDPFGANFTHTMFPLDHGSNEQKATCKTCHPDSGFKTYTCFGCHRHTPANVQAEHERRSITQLSNCVQCHAGGRHGGD